MLPKYIVYGSWDDDEVGSEGPRFDGERGQVNERFVEIETSSDERGTTDEVKRR